MKIKLIGLALLSMLCCGRGHSINEHHVKTTENFSCVGDLHNVNANFVSQTYDYEATFKPDGTSTVSITFGPSDYSNGLGGGEAHASYKDKDEHANDGFISIQLGEFSKSTYESTLDKDNLTLDVVIDVVTEIDIPCVKNK